MKQRKIALFDIDNTIYNGYILSRLAEFQLNEGRISQKCVNSINEDWKLYGYKKVDYETTIKNAMLHWAKGLKGTIYQDVLEQTQRFLLGEGNKFFSFSKKVITLLQKTHDVYFVTGEPQFVGEVVSGQFSITGHISTEFEVKGGIFTGRVKKYLAKREEKQEAVKKLLKQYDIKDSFAFGDSEGDIKMLNSVEHAVCINPKEGLRKIAQERRWRIAKPNEVEKIVKKLVNINPK